MKLTFAIDGREALPVRAIPWVAGAETFTHKLVLPPSLIVLSARTACDSKDTNPGISLLRLYRYDKGGVQPVTAVRLDATAPEYDFQPEADEPLRESTRRLPAGVFVFLDELQSFVDWIYPPGSHDGECRDAIALNTSPDLPDEMIEGIQEGFVARKPVVEAQRSASELSAERCTELAGLPELFVHHWEELTGIGICKGGAYIVSQSGVYPEQYSDNDLRLLFPEERRLLLEGATRPPLLFPCTPSQLLKFVDGGSQGKFEVPEEFRTAVELPALLLQKDSEENASLGTPECVEPPQKKRRDTHYIALLKDLQGKVANMTIECIWLHIQQNAGKDGSIFATASIDCATAKDGRKIFKKGLSRSLLRYLKNNTTTNKVQTSRK